MINNQGFDHDSGSRFFAVGSGRKPQQGRQPGGHTARSMNPENEIFASEGQMLERDKADRLRKQLVAQEQERKISRELGNVGGGNNAGSAYLKCRTVEGKPSKGAISDQTQGSAFQVRAEILGSSNTSKKRAAESIRLSPIKKKTRFVTAKGIREAGRESLSVSQAGHMGETQIRHRNNHEDDDDDLEIV